MTRKERALKNLRQMRSDGRYLGSGSYAPSEVLEDFDFAIKALEQEHCEDCISRAFLIDRLLEKVKTHRSTIEIVDKLIPLIKELPSVKPQEPKTEWIPCSERLPEADEYIGNVAKYYLVQTEYGDMLVARYTHSGYWEQIYQLKPIGDEIVAWMPLPEPYKESEG